MRYCLLIAFTLLLFRSNIYAVGKFGSGINALQGSSAGLQFTGNKGQLQNSNVLFVSVSNSGINTFFFKNSFSYVIAKEEKSSSGQQTFNLPPVIGNPTNHHSKTTFQRIDVEFVNSNQNPAVISGQPVGAISTYYLANCPNGVHALSFQSVTYKDIYPNIDMTFKGSPAGGMEYDFMVRPGANPNDIQMKYTGANGVELSGQTLLIKTISGTLQEFIPRIYQTQLGIKGTVDGHYVVDMGVSNLAGPTPPVTNVKFYLSSYNPLDTLIIDPWITYLTSSVNSGNSPHNGNTYLQGITLTPAGNVVVEGYTNSPFIPTTTGVFQSGLDTISGYSTDILVAEFDTAGNRLWATYYGGSSYEFVYPNGIATDQAGNIVLSAETESTDFPVTAGAFQTSYQGGGNDDCIIKLDPTGNRIWATYCGGSNTEYSGGISVDASGNVIVTGGTASTDFPVSANAFQKTNHSGGYYNAFFIKFDASGNYIWSTYYGGSLSDIGLGLATDKNSNIIMASTSCSADFPVSPGAYQTVNNGPTGFGHGSGDIVLVKMDSSGNRLWATFYGYTGQDAAQAVTTDDSMNIYFTGSTYYGGFPTTNGAYQSSGDYNGSALAAKFSPGGIPVWSTLLSGTATGGHWCYAMGVAVDKAHNVYLCGNTIDNGSPPDDFPSTTCAYQPASAGGQNWWFSKFDPLAQHLLYSSYLGGKTDGAGYGSHCNGLAYANNTFYLCGYSTGDNVLLPDFPVTPGAFQTTPSGPYAYDGVIASIPIGNINMVDFSADRANFCGLGDTVHFTDLSSLGCSLPADSATYNWYFQGGTPSFTTGANPGGIVYDSAGTFNVTLILSASSGSDTLTKNAYISISSGASGAGGIIANPPNLCLGDSSQLTFAGTNGNIQWQSSITGSSYSDITGADSTVYYTTPLLQTTSFRLIVLNGTCADTSSTTIVVVDTLPAPPLLNAGDSLICASDSTLITGPTGYNSYLWNTGDTSNSIYANDGGGYWLTITNSYGCAAVSAHQNISVYPVPSVSITEQGDTLSSFNSSFYQWWFNDSIIAGATGPVYVARQTGNYAVQVTDSNGCSAISSNTYVTINGIAEPEDNGNIHVYPDPFANSIFIRTNNKEMPTASLTIYNELGQVVVAQKISNLSTVATGINVSMLPAGSYYIQVVGASINYLQKMAKQ